MVQLMAKRLFVLILILGFTAAACARRQPPVAKPMPPPATPPVASTTAPPPPPTRIEDALPVPSEPLGEDSIGNRTLDDLNRDSPFKPVFFGLDSAELDDSGRAIVVENAGLLKKYSTWVITVEGHCDERGTAEYNLALGERRAVAVKTYLVSMGIAPDRIRTVSYGKEFPFDPGHDEKAWNANRRAQFVITAK
jgi:peptidoglycan-associated lipoprotein